MNDATRHNKDGFRTSSDLHIKQHNEHLNKHHKPRRDLGDVPRLDSLGPGDSARIAYVGGSGPLRRRLLDMGLTPGTRILFRKSAPLGDPIELNLRGYALSLLRADAHEIAIEQIVKNAASGAK